MYYRNANAAIIVYDISNYQSFERAQKWISELLEKANSGIILALCGNKNDLEKERKVNFEDAQKYADSIGSIFLEVSAKTNHNIDNLFEALAYKLPKIPIEKTGISMTEKKDPEPRNCSC